MLDLTTATALSKTSPSKAQAYGYGTLSVLLICLLSVVGVVVFPLIPKKYYNATTSFMCSLAVGALTGDSLFHLIPIAFGLHGHDHGQDDDHNHTLREVEKESSQNPIFKTIVIVCGIYVFYLVDVLLVMLIPSSDGEFHHHHHDHPDESPPIMLDDVEHLSTGSDIQSNTQINTVKQVSKFFKGVKDASTYCWSILIADMVHNLADGIAIGAAFSQDNVLGLTTSIAIALHEIPHELGDYAIMLKSGLNHLQALVLNFITALTAVIGLFIGVAISSQSDEALSWILAFTAGVFLYVALTDILPHFIPDERSTLQNVLLNNLGLLIGFIIMFLVAYFEEDFKKLLE